MQFDTYCLDSFEDITAFAKWVFEQKFEYCAIDTETDNKSEKLAKLHGIGFCFDGSVAYYIPIRNHNRELIWDTEQLAFITLFVSRLGDTHKLLGHNFLYDALVLENNLGIDLSLQLHADTILMKHCLDEERPFGLKECGVKYLGPWANKAQERLYGSIEKNGGKTNKDDVEMFRADLDVLAEYCSFDTIITYKLFELFEPRLKEEGLYAYFYDVEVMPLYREVTTDMKRRGFPINRPHFERLKEEITADIKRFEAEILLELKPTIAPFVEKLLDEHYPVNRKGNFPKAAAEFLEIELPVDPKTGKVTLGKKALAMKLAESLEKYGHGDLVTEFYTWLLDPALEFPLSSTPIQEKMFFAANPGKRYVFNLSSPDHLRWLLFTKLGMKPIKKTDGGDPACDAETLEEMSGIHPFCDKIIDYKKLCKLDGTYIQGILDREINGVIYCSMLQFGTTSGRYSSVGPNLQNIPRLKDEDSKLSEIVLKYTNAIKAGFVAPPGYVIVNADYSSLEPVCFAHASGDEKLREVFRKGHDLYSSIAIEVWGLYQYSADKKAPNYLGKHKKEIRQRSKIFCLAVVYGAEAGRISQAMGCSYQEAQEIIDNYLGAYPGLKNYMETCRKTATMDGLVRNQFGRLRHLPVAKELWSRYGGKLLKAKWANEMGLKDTRYKLKNQLNNACNFPIQSLAANLVNRAMIAFRREIRKLGLDAYIAVQVHDEITCIARKDQSELVKSILKRCMEETNRISVPLATEPLIAETWAEAK